MMKQENSLNFLAKLYVKKITKFYDEWKEMETSTEIPGRLVLREFDAENINAIINELKIQDKPIRENISCKEQYQINILVEEHTNYSTVDDCWRHPFSTFTEERNKEGCFFTLMFTAETQASLEQIENINQNIVYEKENLKLLIEEIKEDGNFDGFLDEDVQDLLKVVSELTSHKWANRPSISLKRILGFIIETIRRTSVEGDVWVRMGENMIYLDGLKDKDMFKQFRVKKDNEKNKKFVDEFRKIISRGLVKHIDMWRATFKNEPVSIEKIKNYIKAIREDKNLLEIEDIEDFCNDMEEYFVAYISSNEDLVRTKKKEIQNKYDVSYPFDRVLSEQKDKKTKIGEETLVALKDADQTLSDDQIDFLERMDLQSVKTFFRENEEECREFYMFFNDEIHKYKNNSLEKKWSQQLKIQRKIERKGFVEGLLEVFCSFVHGNSDESGDVEYQLRLQSDRTEEQLGKKNPEMLKFFIREYLGSFPSEPSKENTELAKIWRHFGDNFTVDLPSALLKRCTEGFEFKETGSTAASATKLNFRVCRIDRTISSAESRKKSNIIDYQEFEWKFDPNGMQVYKWDHIDQILENVEQGNPYFFRNYCMGYDKLMAHLASVKPSITRCDLLPSFAGMIHHTNEDDSFLSLLEQLLERNFDDASIKILKEKLEAFKSEWVNTLKRYKRYPLTYGVEKFEALYKELLNFFLEKEGDSNRETYSKLLAAIMFAMKLQIEGIDDYAVYMPWSPYSILMQAKRYRTYDELAKQYRNKALVVGNPENNALYKILHDFHLNFGKGVFFYKQDDSSYHALTGSAQCFGYYEYHSLNEARQAISSEEIKSVMKNTIVKYCDIFPYRSYNLKIVVQGIEAYEQLNQIYLGLTKLLDDVESNAHYTLILYYESTEGLSILSKIYQKFCTSFKSDHIDSRIQIVLRNNLEDLVESEVDLCFSFDPLFDEKAEVEGNEPIKVSEGSGALWQYCSSRKYPFDRLNNKSSLSLHNHIQDSLTGIVYKSFLRAAGRNSKYGVVRQVSPITMKKTLEKQLRYSKWVVTYDYLLSQEMITSISDEKHPHVLRYVQGSSGKRSLAVITQSELNILSNKFKDAIQNTGVVSSDNAELLNKKLFNKTRSYSGDALLKSIGNGCFVNDVLGNFASVSLIDSFKEQEKQIGKTVWVYLDDYEQWFTSFSKGDDATRLLGVEKRYLSDLMGLYLTREDNGELTLNIVVAESKLIGDSGDQKIKSSKQTETTVKLISSMLSNSHNFDYHYWLSKVLEFFIEHFEFDSKFLFSDLLDLNSSKTQIKLQGVSVILHTEGSNEDTSICPIAQSDHMFQVRLSYEQTNQLFNCLAKSDESLVNQGFNVVDLRDFLSSKRALALGNLSENDVEDILHPTEITDVVSEETQQEESDEQPKENEEMKFVKELPDLAQLNNAKELDSNVKSSFVKEGISEQSLEENHDEYKIDQIPAKVSAGGCSCECKVNNTDKTKEITQIIDRVIEILAPYQEETTIEEKIPESELKEAIRKIFSPDYLDMPSQFEDFGFSPNLIKVTLKGELKHDRKKIMKFKDLFYQAYGFQLINVQVKKRHLVLYFKRENRQTVYYGEMLSKAREDRSKTTNKGYSDKIAIGESEENGQVMFYRLDGASPHALIAGQTKSGKSVLMSGIILDLIINNRPENMRIHILDPKTVDFLVFRDMPHLDEEIVVTEEDAIKSVTRLNQLMEDRFALLRKNAVSNVDEFEEIEGNEHLCRHVILIDEIATWFNNEKFKKLGVPLVEAIAAKGRAAGFYLILATQRPSADVLSTLIRANVDTRVALKVDSDKNSDIILGSSNGGAENLMGYGHGILKTEGETNIIQVGFIPRKILRKVVEELKEFWKTDK